MRDEGLDQKMIRRKVNGLLDIGVPNVLRHFKDRVLKVMCWNSTGENKNWHESIKNKARKAVSKELRVKAELARTE